jgi:hypothetical protein
MRRPISTRTHGVVDYVTVATLSIAPELFRLKDVSASSAAPRLAGAGAAAYSLFTDYELGAVKALSMRTYLALDAMSGAMLAASPWLFRYAKSGPRYWVPHVAVGVGEVLAAALTEPEPPRTPRLRLLGRALKELLD